MKKGKLVGRGLTAEVYEWGPDKVLKLYYQWMDRKRATYEAEIGRIVHGTGIPSPAVYDTVEVDGRKGVVFERVFGTSLLRHAEAEFDKVGSFAQQMAGLHLKLHQHSSDQLPAQKERLTVAIHESSGILGDKEKKIIRYLNGLPGGTTVCHGDLHFDNIIVTGKGLVVIDWINASSGNPLGDVARTRLMIGSPVLPPGTPYTSLMPYMLAKWVSYWIYTNEYIRLAGVGIAEIDAWLLPVAAARLHEKIPGEEPWLMGIINSQLMGK